MKIPRKRNVTQSASYTKLSQMLDENLEIIIADCYIFMRNEGL